MPRVRFRKDSLMSDEEANEMEYLITEIILRNVKNTVKNESDMSKMAKAVNKKLEENFGGSWTVFIFSKNFRSGWAGIPPNGTFIEVELLSEHEGCHFVMFRK